MVYDASTWVDAINTSLPGHKLVVIELVRWITDSLNERRKIGLHPPGPPIGLILYGSSGTGKSALCAALQEHKPLDVHVVYLQGEEIYQHENPMAAITQTTCAIDSRKSTLLIVDNISSMCPANSKHESKGNSRIEDTVVEQFAILLDSWRDARWTSDVSRNENAVDTAAKLNPIFVMCALFLVLVDCNLCIKASAVYFMM